jgi:predicted nucleic acid-binding Zn ribbon protein
MPMLKRAHQPERIDQVLKRTLKGLKIEKRIKEETVVLNWNKVVGDRIARESIPVKVKDAILFVKVENASWRNELVFLKDNIIRGLNQSVGASVIKEIVFTN